MSKFKSVTIILARGGSKGVPGKNLRPVGGVSLIGRAVRAGLQAKSQEAVYVSSDDANINIEAEKHGARIILRPPELAGDTSTSEAGWLHALSIVRQDIPNIERLVFLQCTSPFIRGSDIDAVMDVMTEAKADCALSVVEDHSFLWSMDQNGKGIGQNHDHTQQRKRRQDLPPQYRENGAIYCVNATAFEKTEQRFCGSVALCPVDQPPIEIDNHSDLELATAIANLSGQSDVPYAALQAVKVLVMDFDGVHTDNLVSTNMEGQESVTTSRGDGMGLAELNKNTNIKRLIVSKERNPVVLARAKKLSIDAKVAVDDKVGFLEAWLAKHNMDWGDVLYVGNDINDAAAMRCAGLAACPSDSHSSVFGLAQWILPYPGGRGALRYLCDTLIKAQNAD